MASQAANEPFALTMQTLFSEIVVDTYGEA